MKRLLDALYIQHYVHILYKSLSHYIIQKSILLILMKQEMVRTGE